MGTPGLAQTDEARQPAALRLATENKAPVSVVIPCFRCADSIERAVLSVAAQTLLPQEVILVDDCSQDGTMVTLESLAVAFPPGWIKVLSLAVNGGPGWARNAGWELACAQYIAFLDADDIWHPQKLALQTARLQAHPELVMSAHRSVLMQEVAVPVPLPSRMIDLRALLFANMIPTRSVMLKRELPLRFPLGWRYSEDYMLWLAIAASGGAIDMLEVPLAFSFRPAFRAGGLSARLWLMERGELASFSALRREKRIGWGVWGMASAWSLLRYIKRLAQAVAQK
ncbi:MAG: cell wall biosis glycosyltransferase [Rhodocyclales bacterium]|nr:cell wall biosis glycosyltransferase [Rhodocyclales bacterium]